jgi:HIV Tat-specific factor 1
VVQCIAVMEGRFFGGRQLEAALWDGIQQFHVKPAKKAKEETEAEQQARLERFAAEIEAQEAPSLESPVPLDET